MDLGGNLKEKSGKALVGEYGAANAVGVCRGGNSGGTYLGNNGPSPEGEGGVSGCWDCGGGAKSMRGGSELNTEEEGVAP